MFLHTLQRVAVVIVVVVLHFQVTLWAAPGQSTELFSFFSVRRAILDTVKMQRWCLSAAQENKSEKEGDRHLPSFCPTCFPLENNLTPPQLPSSSWTSWSGEVSMPWSWGFRTGAHLRELGALPVVQFTYVSEQQQLLWESAVSRNDLGYRKQLLLFFTVPKDMRRNLSYKRQRILEVY